MVHGSAKGLELFRALDGDPRISGHYRLDAVRAHLLEKTAIMKVPSNTTELRLHGQRAFLNGITS